MLPMQSLSFQCRAELWQHVTNDEFKVRAAGGEEHCLVLEFSSGGGVVLWEERCTRACAARRRNEMTVSRPDDRIRLWVRVQ